MNPTPENAIILLSVMAAVYAVGHVFMFIYIAQILEGIVHRLNTNILNYQNILKLIDEHFEKLEENK